MLYLHVNIKSNLARLAREKSIIGGEKVGS